MTAVLRIVGWAWVALVTLVLLGSFWIAGGGTLFTIGLVSIAALSPGLGVIAVAHFLDWKRLHG
jgi:hypothetical protein